jgi:hypothetical protein
MTLSRRDALKHILSATALGGLGSVTALTEASADGLKLAMVNVMDYGATGNGTTDDTAAIHAARDAAGVGGRVIIPAGTFIVSGLTASVVNQTWELGNRMIGKATIRMKAEAASILHVTAAGVTVDGGVFDGSSGTLHNWSQQGIHIEADAVTVRNAEVRGSPCHGVYALDSDRVTVAGCRFTDCYSAGVIFQNGTDATDRYDVRFTGNHIESSLDTSYGIGVVGGAVRPVHRITISHNTVLLKVNPTEESSCIGVSHSTDWLVSDNFVRGSSLGISCPLPVRATISNNQVWNFNQIGIEIPGAVTDCMVSNNVINAQGADGAYGSADGVQASQGTVKGLSVIGNTISGFQGNMSGISFSKGSVVESATVSGNVVRGDCNKFCGLSIANTAKNVTISDNIFDAGTVATDISGICCAGNNVNAVLNTAIVGNVFTSKSSAGSNYAIYFGPDATASGITVSRNTIKATGSADFAAFHCYSSATNVVFTGNSVNAGTSTLSSGVDLYNAVDGLNISGNQFSNLTEAVVRLMASTAVTMKNIKVTGNGFMNVPYRIMNLNTGGAVVEDSVISTDK